MLRLLVRAAIVASIALIGSASWPSSAVLAKTGETPLDGYSIPEIWSYSGSGALDPGAQTWIKIGYPGGAMGITMHFRPEDRDAQRAVKAYVNVRLGDGVMGKPNADWKNLSRIGELGQTNNTGSDRLFWFQDKGTPQDIFLLVRNDSGRRLPFVISTDWRDAPVSYISPLPAPGTGTVFVRMGGSGDVVPYFWISTSLLNPQGEQNGWANVEQLGSGTLNVELGLGGVDPGSYAVRLRTNGTCDANGYGTTGELVATSAELAELDVAAGDSPAYQASAQPVEGGPIPLPALGANGAAVVVYQLDGDALGAPVACGLLQQQPAV